MDRRAPLPVRDARHRPRTDARFVRVLRRVAKENGYEAQSQHRGYLFKVHVDDTEELAYETARKYVSGPPNPFLEGNQGEIRPFIQNLPA